MDWLFDRSYPADTAVLCDIRQAVAEACRRAGAGEECGQELVLAINEACMNIIQHGYGFGPDQTFRLQVFVSEGSLVVRFLDNARPVGECDLCPRSFDELRPGGLGVHFMREVTDSLEYLTPPAGYTNMLQMTKRIR